jgi:hypothetical protein
MSFGNGVVAAAGQLMMWTIFGSISIVAVGGQETNSSESTAPSAVPTLSLPTDDWYNNYTIPPWGVSSFGFVNRYGSAYRDVFGFADVVRPGWSWTRPEMRTSMMFCYDSIPGVASTCYTGQVKELCEGPLRGSSTAEDHLCLTDQPFSVVGPTCWNKTCYFEETKEACEAIGGYLIGTRDPAEVLDPQTDQVVPGQAAAWCIVRGNDHTILGPACFGTECFKEELSVACETLGGKNFAGLFCLLEKSYKVIGPICSPTSGPIENASVCYEEETTALCDDMNGTSVGGIFCVVKGEYSVLGPFCTTSHYQDEPEISYANCASKMEGEAACSELSGSSVGNGTFCVLPGLEYRLLGPLCDANGGCWVYNDKSDPATGNGCQRDFQGTAVGSYSCIIKGEYTIIGPATYGGMRFEGGNVMGPDLTAESVISLIQGNGPTVLNGTYSVFGPTCYGASCYEADCESKIDGIFCAVKTKSEWRTPSPAPTSSSAYTSPSVILSVLGFSAFALAASTIS